MKKKQIKLTLIFFNFLIIFLILFFPIVKSIAVGKHTYSNGVSILAYRIKSLPEPSILLKIKNTTRRKIIPIVYIEVERGGQKTKAEFNNLEALAPEEEKELEVNIADHWRTFEIAKVKVQILSFEGKFLARAEGKEVREDGELN